MKARVVRCKGNYSPEYFTVAISGIKLNSELLGDMELDLRFSSAQYDWIDNPEAVISEIVKRINKEVN